MSEKILPSYGGQALIEGVLMRGKKYLAASFRKPDGSIETVTEELTGIYKSKITKSKKGGPMYKMSVRPDFMSTTY